jgi:hypothetical protein
MQAGGEGDDDDECEQKGKVIMMMNVSRRGDDDDDDDECEQEGKMMIMMMSNVSREGR